MIKNRNKKDRPKTENLSFLTDIGAEFVLYPREIAAEQRQEFSFTVLRLLPDIAKKPIFTSVIKGFFKSYFLKN